ncbi:MAG: hypothetical protein SH856_01095 [Flavobacteriales bacterium]|nr:hypothetical protein [Flavobacteriales bacterium]
MKIEFSIDMTYYTGEEILIKEFTAGDFGDAYRIQIFRSPRNQDHSFFFDSWKNDVGEQFMPYWMKPL